jgi:hypothetical protein
MKKALLTRQQSTTAQRSKLQLKYEKILNDIEIQEQLQANLKEGIQLVLPRIQAEIIPLMKKKNQLIRKRLLRLDALSDEIGVTKQNKEYFDSYMSKVALYVLDVVGFQDSEIKNLYTKYSGERAELSDEEVDKIATQFRQEYGLEIDKEEVKKKGIDAYIEENNDILQKKIQQEAKNAFEKIAEAVPAKLSKVQELLQQDAKLIYKRLVKKLHPDLELKEAIKVKKTAILQEVTKAYQEVDFLALLRLQIEYLDESEVNASLLAEDILKRYTKIVSKQLEDMKQSHEMLKMQSMGLVDDFFDHQHKFRENKFKKIKKEIKEEIFAIEDDIKISFQRTKEWFKEWTKEITSYHSGL